MKMKRKLIPLFVIAFLCVACAPTPTPTKLPAEATSTLPASTPLLPEPSAIATLTLLAEPTVATIQTPYVPFTLANTVENAVLRAGPGALFTAKTTLAQNTLLTAIGISPGREWVFVVTPFDTTGWIFVGLLEAKPELATVPLVQPADVQLVRGQVLGPDRHPIKGIQFALIQGVGVAGSPPRTDAVTDEHGFFYAFLPTTATGTWTVSFTAVTCTSTLMDANCQCIGGDCGKADPEITTITLPMTDIVTFEWK
jgi:hypothetical protein